MVLTAHLPDHKCTMTLYDLSTQDEGDGILLNIFRPPEHMPYVEAGDIVTVYSAKVQFHNSDNASLLTSYQTTIHIYDGARLSKCTSARIARKDSSHECKRTPDAKDEEYVLSLYQRLDKTIIPDDATTRAHQSLNVQEKFSELKDVEERRFVDLIVEVAKQPYDLGDKICLWVSDYTEHTAFFNHQPADGLNGFGRDGDPLGYTYKFNRNRNMPPNDGQQWLGPSGKMSMQITCWGPHADFIRNQVKGGDWVRLRNVQIGRGRGVENMEGFLREDTKYPDRLYVETLDPAADGEMIDPRLKNAIRRKRDYDREHKRKGKGQGKRSAPDEPVKENTKSKRKKSRTEKQKEHQEKENKAEEQIGLNDLIICENHDRSILPLSAVLQPIPYHTTINNEPVTLDLPFTNVNFRAQVRVVDFHPAKLEDFAVNVKQKKYPCLAEEGDESDEDGSPSSSDSEIDPEQVERVGYVWEWRFALKVEEVVPSASSKTNNTKKKSAASVWALVNNQDAQLLTGLDAVNLHSEDNKGVLSDLRERMFSLWGNLEECKTWEEASKKKQIGKQLEAPPVDSDDEEREITANMNIGPASSQLTNKPFRCCLQQYGIKVETEKNQDDNAGEGYRWERMFGLFGTKIRGD